MWRPTTFRCPACGDLTRYRDDRIEGTVCESDEECRNPTCGLWSHTFRYGNVEERVGAAVFQWSWRAESWGDDQRRDCYAAVAEMTRAGSHPDWPVMRRSPDWMLADWCDENGFPIQAAALRERLAAASQLSN